MRTIELTQGKFAMVDDDLFDTLNAFRWCAYEAGKTFYAHRAIILPNGKQKTISIHRFIFELKGEPVPNKVDHRDRDGLNNQFDNLRPATHAENIRNSGLRPNNKSGFIGVSWDTQHGRWMSKVVVDGKQINLGRYDRPDEAAFIRDEFVRHHHGEFAVLNFPEGVTP